MINQHDPSKITTLGGDCPVSIAPFTALAHRYGDDLAVVWIDSHPDVGTSASEYSRYQAMAVSVLTGHGDPHVASICPQSSAPSGWRSSESMPGPGTTTRTSACGASAASVQTTFARTATISSTVLAHSGCTRIAIHLDVDAIDSNEMFLGLGAIPSGLTSPQVRRIIGDISTVVEIVALTIAEFIPRQVIQVEQLLADMPLIEPSSPAGS